MSWPAGMLRIAATILVASAQATTPAPTPDWTAAAAASVPTAAPPPVPAPSIPVPAAPPTIIPAPTPAPTTPASITPAPTTPAPTPATPAPTPATPAPTPATLAPAAPAPTPATPAPTPATSAPTPATVAPNNAGYGSTQDSGYDVSTVTATAAPTTAATAAPTLAPTAAPTLAPTVPVTVAPTVAHTNATAANTTAATHPPTQAPAQAPTVDPSLTLAPSGLQQPGGDGCDLFMIHTGCDWTLKFNCPGQSGGPHQADADTSHGFYCCCKKELWKQVWSHTTTASPVTVAATLAPVTVAATPAPATSPPAPVTVATTPAPASGGYSEDTENDLNNVLAGGPAPGPAAPGFGPAPPPTTTQAITFPPVTQAPFQTTRNSMAPGYGSNGVSGYGSNHVSTDHHFSINFGGGNTNPFDSGNGGSSDGYDTHDSDDNFGWHRRRRHTSDFGSDQHHHFGDDGPGTFVSPTEEPDDSTTSPIGCKYLAPPGCKIPFNYEGVNYHGCTTDDPHTGILAAITHPGGPSFWCLNEVGQRLSCKKSCSSAAMMHKIVQGVTTGVLASGAAAGAAGLIAMEVERHKKGAIKFPWEHDKVPAAVTTNISTPVAAGTATLPVATQAGFAVGDTIIIGAGTPTEENNTIMAFGSIILKTPLKFAHPAGAIISKEAAPIIPPTTQPPATQPATPPPVVAARIGSTLGPQATADAAAPEDPAAKRKRTLIIAGVAALVGCCCICIIAGCVVLGCAKRHRRTKGFDKVAESDRMYDLEEPAGPTDSMYRASPYQDYDGTQYTDGESKSPSLQPTQSFPLQESVYAPAAVPMLNNPVPTVVPLAPQLMMPLSQPSPLRLG